MTLDVRNARVIVECARLGSLGRAAAALNMTQPAITRMLKRTEADFGVPLFERNSRGVILTAYGSAVLPYAKLVISEIANAEDVVRQMRGASRGVVRVGGVGSVVGEVIVTAVTAMRAEHPDVQFHIFEELEDRLLDRLKAGAIDIAVSPEPYTDDEVTLATPEALKDVVFAFVRAGHPALTGNALTLAEAADLDWALPPADTPVMSEWLKRFHLNGIEPRQPCLLSRSVQVIKAAVLNDDLACWLPAPVIAGEVARGEVSVLPCQALEWRRSFRLWRRKSGLMTPSAQILVQHLRALAMSK